MLKSMDAKDISSIVANLPTAHYKFHPLLILTVKVKVFEDEHEVLHFPRMSDVELKSP